MRAATVHQTVSDESHFTLQHIPGTDQPVDIEPIELGPNLRGALDLYQLIGPKRATRLVATSSKLEFHLVLSPDCPIVERISRHMQLPVWDPKQVVLEFRRGVGMQRIDIALGENELKRDGVWKSIITTMRHHGSLALPPAHKHVVGTIAVTGQNKRPIEIFNEFDISRNNTIEFQEFEAVVCDKLRCNFVLMCMVVLGCIEEAL